jgi:hypothetical protein
MSLYEQDAWNIGRKQYKELLPVHQMAAQVQRFNVACVEMPLWQVVNGPDHLQFRVSIIFD